MLKWNYNLRSENSIDILESGNIISVFYNQDYYILYARLHIIDIIEIEIITNSATGDTILLLRIEDNINILLNISFNVLGKSILDGQNPITSEGVHLMFDKRKRAVSKWKKVNNTIRFIKISKDCAKKSKSFKNIHDEFEKKTSKWTLVKIAISMVSFLTQKTKCVSGQKTWADQKVTFYI